MTHFDEDVTGKHGPFCRNSAIRPLVVIHQVLCDAGPLGFPVQPYTLNAVVDIVSPDRDINGGMEFDACGLRTA